MNLQSWFSSDSEKPGSRSWILIAAAVFLAVPLLIRIYIGTLARFTSDDFCWSMVISERGFLGLQAHLYLESYGRLASSALLGFMSYFGDVTAPILPVIIIVLCTASMAWLGYEITKRLWLSIIIAQAILIAAFTMAPKSALEPLYWQSALLTYLPPFFIGPLGAALSIRHNSLTIAVFTALLVCQFNEATSVVVVSGLVLILPFVGRSRRRLVYAALLAGVLSTALVAASPGNAIRRNDPNPINYMSLLADSLLTTGRLVADVALSRGSILLFILGAAVASHVRLKRKTGFLRDAFICFLLAIPPIAASVYGVKTLMARTAIVPTFALAAAILFLGLGIGSFFIIRNGLPLLICAALFAAVTGAQSMSLLPTMQEFNRAWEAQNELLTKSPPDAQVTIIPSINPFPDSWQLRSDQTWVINRCVATFYNVKSVQLAENP
ncbi:MAG: hypothetical protein JXA73_19120 [Acidobacteria bacterium]|nr:hypothetical protein [Acidobacteriota bacterium]